jgi:hypothetical protein
MTTEPIEVKLSEIENPEARALASKALIDLARKHHREALLELHDRGWSWAKIGDLIGTSRQNASQVAHRNVGTSGDGANGVARTRDSI